MPSPEQAQQPREGQGEDGHIDHTAHTQTARELLLMGIKAKAPSAPLEENHALGCLTVSCKHFQSWNWKTSQQQALKFYSFFAKVTGLEKRLLNVYRAPSLHIAANRFTKSFGSGQAVSPFNTSTDLLPCSHFVFLFKKLKNYVS